MFQDENTTLWQQLTRLDIKTALSCWVDIRALLMISWCSITHLLLIIDLFSNFSLSFTVNTCYEYLLKEL